MGWLRSVGSIKLQVSFAEYRLFYRALLQKTYNFIDPTNQSHPIFVAGVLCVCLFLSDFMYVCVCVRVVGVVLSEFAFAAISGGSRRTCVYVYVCVCV